MTLLIAVGVTSHAVGQPASQAQPANDAPAASKGPWYDGVSLADQEQARKLHAEAAALHNQLFYAQAVARYQEALTHWKHPDIYFNLTRAYIKLERPLQAYESLLEALRHGADSLAPENYNRALEYKQLLEGQLATIDLRCDEPGAIVTVDGEEVFTAPGNPPGRGADEVIGSKKVWVRPGTHRIVAAKLGFLADDQWIQVFPGDRKQVALKPMSMRSLGWVEVSCREPDAEVTLDGAPFMRCPNSVSRVLISNVQHTFIISRPERITTQKVVVVKPGDRRKVELGTLTQFSVDDFTWKRRWQPWKPWAVTGAGMALVLAGAMFEAQSAKHFREFDNEVARACTGSPSPGCGEDDVRVPDSKLTLARWENRLGVGGLVVGGAAVVAGLAMAIIDRPYVARKAGPEGPRLEINPIVDPSSAGRPGVSGLAASFWTRW